MFKNTFLTEHLRTTASEPKLLLISVLVFKLTNSPLLTYGEETPTHDPKIMLK